MIDVIMLDSENASYFEGLFQGNINDCTDTSHISFGALYEGVPAALIVLNVEGGELYLEWLYTANDLRGNGIMSDLLRYVAESLYKVTDAWLLNVICSGKEIKTFLELNDFSFSENYKLTNYTAFIKDMKDFGKGQTSQPTVKLSEMTKAELNAINNDLAADEESSDGVLLPILPGDYNEFSCATVTDNKLKALLLFKQEEEGVIDVAFAYKAAGCEVTLMKMLMSAKNEIEGKLTGECKIRAVALNEASDHLFNGLFPKAEKEFIYKGSLLLM